MFKYRNKYTLEKNNLVYVKEISLWPGDVLGMLSAVRWAIMNSNKSSSLHVNIVSP